MDEAIGTVKGKKYMLQRRIELRAGRDDIVTWQRPRLPLPHCSFGEGFCKAYIETMLYMAFHRTDATSPATVGHAENACVDELKICAMTLPISCPISLSPCTVK